MREGRVLSCGRMYRGVVSAWWLKCDINRTNENALGALGAGNLLSWTTTLAFLVVLVDLLGTFCLRTFLPPAYARVHLQYDTVFHRKSVLMRS